MALRDSTMGEASKLDGNTNYSVWSFKMRNVMTREDTWKLVEPPAGTVAPTDPAELAALRIQKNKALTTIGLSVRDNVIPYIANITEPDVCWATLKNLYANSTNSRKLMLRRRLTNLKLEEGSSMTQFLQHLKELINELACVGEIISDNQIVEHVLMALPESYEGLVNTLMYRPALPTVAELTVILMQDDIRRELRSQKKGDGEALFIKTKRSLGNRKPAPSRGEGQTKSMKTGVCHYCGQTDHWIRNCPELAAELKRRKESRKEPATINFIDNLECSDSDNEEPNLEPELAVNFTELNLVDHQSSDPTQDWYVDSGASRHVTGRKDLLSELEPGSHSRISTAGGERLNIVGKGKVEISTDFGEIKFGDVLYVPGVTKNLLSVGRIADGKGKYKLLFDSKKVWILKDFPAPESSHVVTLGHRDHRNGLYKFRPPEVNINIVTPSKDKSTHTSCLWHRRLGHANLRTMQHMAAKQKAEGLPSSFTALPFCSGCSMGKQTRVKIPTKKHIQPSCRECQETRRMNSEASMTRTSKPLELVHTDLCGPLTTASSSGSRYMLTITDDFSRYTWLFFLKKKSDTLSKFQQFKTMIELQGNFKLKTIRSDRGGEYTSSAFISFCETSGIVRQLTQAHTPHQNGVAERKNRSLMEKARCMAFESNLPPSLWTEAVATANYVVNRTATRANNGDSPFSRLTGLKPSVKHLRTFGCRTFVMNTAPAKQKWSPRATECIFLGYDSTSTGYRNYHLSSKKILISKDVAFDETCFPLTVASAQALSTQEPRPEFEGDSARALPDLHMAPMPLGPPTVATTPCSSAALPRPHLTESLTSTHEGPTDTPTVVNNGELTIEVPILPDTSSHAQVPVFTYQRRQATPSASLPVSPSASLPVSRSGRMRQPPHRFQDFYLNVVEDLSCSNLPQNAAQALLHPGWKEAMEDELRSIHRNNTWDLVPLPLDRQAISTKWVFRVKTNANGSIAKLKARLVARGFQQKEGQDYKETFAPVVKWNTLRSIVSLAGHRGWSIFHLDVKTAFLNGIIEEDIYVTPPPGFESSHHRGYACKLKKALYGLKQAPRAWYSKVDHYLCSQGLQKSSADANLYFHESQGKLTLLLLYVDDVYLTGNDTVHIELIRQAIQTEFEMSDLGLLSFSLGLEFLFSASGIRVTQRQYVKDMLAEFGLSECRPAATPMQEKLQLLPDMKAAPADSVHYQRMVGKLIFLTHTRPDIAYAVSVVSRFMAAPQVPHAQAVKHLYRYLQGTIDLALFYRRGEDEVLYGFTDADWAGDAYDRRSTTGYIFMSGSTPVTWNSKKQPTVALSSTESEYMAITEGTKEAVWLRRLFGELKIQDSRVPTTIHGDNQGSLNLAHNPVYHGRTKHIEVKHHFIREKILSKEICLEYIPTSEQLADILTKALGRTAFERLRSQLGLVFIDTKKPMHPIRDSNQSP